LQSMSCPAAQVSVQGVHPVGQKPSDAAPQVRGVVVHANVQLATEPAFTRTWSLSFTQASDCVWQVEGGSHVSPASTAELPQVIVQSLSLLALHPAAQQPSPLVHVAMTVVFTHLAEHAAAVPCSARSWQAIAGHTVGQFAPSHVSLQAASVR